MEETGTTEYVVAHLSDLHLGYRDRSSIHQTGIDPLDGSPIPLRELDGYKAWDAVIDGVINDGVDAVVIAGDIGHEPNPSVRALRHMQVGLLRLAEAGIPVHNITGNHDTNDIRGDIAFTELLHRPDAGIYSHSQPYKLYHLTDDIALHMVSHHMYTENVEVMSEVNPLPGVVNILTTHGSLIDPLLKERIKVHDTVREVVIPDSFLNAGWDAMMLGHIHERGYVGDPKQGIFYNGSLIRRGFSDAEGNMGRGYTLWKFSMKNGVVAGVKREVRSVWQRPQEDLPPIEASGLDSVALTEAILANLPAESIDYDPETAPILRQKVIGAEPAVFASRDQSVITHAASHALSYSLTPQAPKLKPVSSDEDTLSVSEAILKPAGLEESYHAWADKSQTLNSVADEDMRRIAYSQGAEYLRRGIEKVFESNLSA